MNIPNLPNPQKFKSLYIVDFGDYSSTGFTADEVAMLLESEKFSNIKVYKIHNAYPDGKFEIKGVANETFNFESGMFFYASDLETAQNDFDRLVSLAITVAPPSRAKVQLAEYADGKFVTAIIYPAEYNDEISRWLLEINYKTLGLVNAGIEATTSYYENSPAILQRHQLFASIANESRTAEELIEEIAKPFQRYAG